MDTLSATQRVYVRELLQKRYGGRKRRPRVAATSAPAAPAMAEKAVTLPTIGKVNRYNGLRSADGCRMDGLARGYRVGVWPLTRA